MLGEFAGKQNWRYLHSINLSLTLCGHRQIVLIH